jgi:NADH-quinone oxidoreductase subunit H
VTVSMLATTLFLGGWRAPWPLSLWHGANQGYWPVLWFLAKVFLFVFVFIWLRGTLPRLRYDQFMKFGWKVLIPVSLVWIVAVGSIRTLSLEGPINRTWLIGAAAVALVIFLVLGFIGESPVHDEAEQEPTGFDAFAGGYPVPPMPGQLTADGPLSVESLPADSTTEGETIRG